MTRFDHSVDVGDGKRYVKVVFPVRDEPVGSESMWAEVLPGDLLRVKNIPIWTSDISLDDVVAGRRRRDQVWFDGVRERAGHSTYRIAFQGPDGTQNPQPDFDRLIEMGCALERASKSIVAIDVPAEMDIDAVYRFLEDGMARGIWWFDELHCGHSARGPKPG
jgi:hypothetical protein